MSLQGRGSTGCSYTGVDAELANYDGESGCDLPSIHEKRETSHGKAPPIGVRSQPEADSVASRCSQTDGGGL